MTYEIIPFIEKVCDACWCFGVVSGVVSGGGGGGGGGSGGGGGGGGGGGSGGGGGFVVAFWNSQVCVVNAVCCQKNVGLEYAWQKPFGVKG